MNPYYITGLCEGEASFTYGQIATGIRPRFVLSLTYSDKELVEKVFNFFKIGKIYYGRAGKRNSNCGYTEPKSMYCVVNPEDLEIIISHFDVYNLTGKKARSYQVWKKIVEARRLKLPKETQIDLAKSLSALSTKGRPSLRPERID